MSADHDFSVNVRRKEYKWQDKIISFQTNIIKPMLRVALVDREGKEKCKTDAGMETNSFIDYLVAEHNLILWFNIAGG